MGPTHRLAIDLGTCHTVAVVRRGDEAPRALLFDGSPVMASGIYADEHGKLSVGRDAERLSQFAPDRFEPYPKRSVDEGAVLLGSVEVSVVEMLASLLRRAAEESLQAGVNPVGSTVLTCPADWGGQRRGVLLEAARAADLGPVVLVDEPIAAATYCLRVLGQQVAPLQSLAVFDFGGGTLDVSVVRREFDGLRVLGVGGLDDLGGVDIDAALVGHLGQLIDLRHPELWQRLAHPDTPAAHRDRRALWTEVRAAKEMLSRAATAPIHVPGTEEALHLTREELERVAGPLIDRAVDETRRVLERAGVDVRQLAGIFLVGGSSRIPLVASRLHARFGVAPVVPEQPELPVAYGGMLAVGAPPQQQFDPSRPVSGTPVSGTPVSPSHSPTLPPSSFPVSGGFAAAQTTSSGSFGSPAAMASPFAAAPASPAAGVGSPVTPAPGPGRSPGLIPGQAPGQMPGQVPGARPGMPAAPPRVGGPPAPGPPFVAGVGAATAPPVGQGAFTPPPGNPGAFNPPPAPRRRRSGPWITLVIVLALIGSCVWGGTKVFGWMGRQFEAVKDGLPGGVPTDDNGNLANPKVDGLEEGAVIKVDANAGAFTALAGTGAIYTAESTADATKVSAYATTGESIWTVSVQMAPEELHLSLVGDLLLVDGERDGKRDGNDVRSVIDRAGKVKWTETWDSRIDLMYLRNGGGVDAITEVRSSPSSVQRIDLMTGRSSWTHPGEKTFFVNGQRTAKPALTWTKSADSGGLPVPSYDVTFSNPLAFDQSLGADPATVVHLTDEKTVTLVNVADGKTKATAQIKNERNGLFAAYGGTLIVRTPGSDNALVGYSLRDLSKMWDYKAPPGASVEDIRPCGEKIVCLSVNKSLNYTFVAINAGDGKEAWSKAGDEPNWYVLDGQLMAGKDSGGGVDSPSVLNPANGGAKYGVADSATAPTVLSGGGGLVAVQTLRSALTTAVWQVSIAKVGTGKVVGTADVSTDGLTDVSVSGDSVTAVDEKGFLIHRYSIPKS